MKKQLDLHIKAGISCVCMGAVSILLTVHALRQRRKLLLADAAVKAARNEAARIREEAEAEELMLCRQIQISRQWQRVSETDALTGLLNRGGGETRIRECLDLCGCGMFCLLDLDSFKHINDAYGHRAGDQALRGIAGCMRRSFRDDDILMRLGGDEFAIFAPGISTVEEAGCCLKRMFVAIENMILPEIPGERITVSVGAVLRAESDPDGFDELYRIADSAMYRCKCERENSLLFSGLLCDEAFQVPVSGATDTL